MKTVSTDCRDFNVNDVIAFDQQWTVDSVYSYIKRPRPNHGIMLVLCDKMVFYFNGDALTAERNDIIYLPMGARYEVEFFDCKDVPADRLVNFTLTSRDGCKIRFSDHPVCLMRGAGSIIRDMFGDIVYGFARCADNAARLKSGLLGIFGEIFDALAHIELYSHEYSVIAKGIEYIEQHVSDNTPVCELARMCNVSESCFYRMFRRYAGESPASYRCRIRILKAKQLLRGSDLSVGEIGEYLGYYDNAYFCRSFKSETGMTPKKYRDALISGREN